MRQILIKSNSRSSTFNNHFKPISMNNTSALLGYFSYLHPSMPSVRAIESSQTLDCVEPSGHKTRKLLSLPSLELSPFQADDSRSYTALQKRLGAGAHSLGRVLVQIWQVNLLSSAIQSFLGISDEALENEGIITRVIVTVLKKQSSEYADESVMEA